MPTPLTCFKPYDIRGKLGEELNADIAYQIGRAFAQYLNAKTIVIGCDIRNSSPELKAAVASGIMDVGADVIDIGMTGSEEVYFAAFHLEVDGGVEITASHNPMDYNGMKFVGKGATPIGSDTGLPEIKQIISQQRFNPITKIGKLSTKNILPNFVEHLLGYIDLTNMASFKLVVNAGNGAAGHVIDVLEAIFDSKNIAVQFIKIHHQPDGNFPNGIPNPILKANQKATQEAVLAHQADFGIAWDGDFDRCFLFDENGRFLEGYYIVGLLAQAFLAKNPNDKIIHDPRLIWNTLDIVAEAGGIAVQSKTGHAFIKAKMRQQNAVYGGEMSAHHYFRDFAYCDSGMIPWLLVLGLLNTTGKKLSQLVNARITKFPCSGEINYQVKDTQLTLDKIHNHFASQALSVDTTDGLGFEFADWRFNVRGSNTEPLLRLNVESRQLSPQDANKINEYVAQIEALIQSL